MPKVRSGPSKRKSSRQRHKIERKKREHKRDLRKAAKALKNSGLGPKRNKKSRELARLALKVSNAHPDKESIISRVLQVREDARVARANKRNETSEGEDSTIQKIHENHVSHPRKKAFTYIPVRESNNFVYQFNRTLEELVFPPADSLTELPSAAYLITLDARFSVQSIPWGLLDTIVNRSVAYHQGGGKKRVLILFALTKIDLISAPAIVTQFSLVAQTITKRYMEKQDSRNPPQISPCLSLAFCPVSIEFEKTLKHVLRILRQFHTSEGCAISEKSCNLQGKLYTFIVGLPHTGRRTLTRTLLRHGGDSAVGIVPVSSAQLHIKENEDEQSDSNMKLVFPNTKEITLLQFPEDALLRQELFSVSGGDVFFKSLSFVERLADPEVIACMLFEAAIDKVSLAQGFCQPIDTSCSAFNEKGGQKMAERFLRALGRTVRREKGFYVSPLFVSNAGSMGRISNSSLTASVRFTSRQQSTQFNLLDASYSNATPNKLVRISSVVAPSRGKRKTNPTVKRLDSHSALKCGARTFVREIHQGRNIPWAVMRPPGIKTVTKEEIEYSSLVFNLSLCTGKKLSMTEVAENAREHFSALLSSVTFLLKQYVVFLPNGVVEFDPDSIVAPIHELNATDHANGEEEEEAVDGADDGTEEKEDEEESSEVFTDEEDGEENEEEDESEEEEEEEED